MKIKGLLENQFKRFAPGLGIFLLATSLIILGILFPKSAVVGDVIQPNNSGSWQGTLGPSAPGTINSDIESLSGNLERTYNTIFSRYEVGLVNGQTSGTIKSFSISPAGGTLKKWNKIKFGFIRPTSGSSGVTVDILCGDPSQPPGCVLDNPIAGFINIPLNASDEYDIPASLTITQIKLRVNFSRSVVTDPSILMYDWQVFWELNSGVSVVVSKTPNPANPTLQTGFDTNPGVPNNNTVAYTVSYSLDRNVDNFTIELPYPTGCYQPTFGSPVEYTVAFNGSSGGGVSTAISGAPMCSPKNKIVWNLGNKSSGTVGNLTATFRVFTGAPNGMTLKSKAKFSGNSLVTVELPEDQLNIQAKAFMYGSNVGPQYIAPNLDVTYMLILSAANYWVQSDVYNARFEFTYSNCLLNTSNPTVTGTGATSVVFDNANRKVSFYLTSPQTTSYANYKYAVTIRAGNSCGSPTLQSNLTVFSDQEADFVKTKTTTVTSTWDAASLPRVTVDKYGSPFTVGAGHLMDYVIKFDHSTNVPATEFYTIEKIPSNTTFVNVNFYGVGHGTTIGAPNATNWKIYWSSYTGAGYPPRGNHTGGWTLCASLPSTTCTVPSGQESSVKWIKFDVGSGESFKFDRYMWGPVSYPVNAEIALVTDTNASGSVDNEIKTFAGNICQSGCTYNTSNAVDNKPNFYTSYSLCINPPINPSPIPQNCTDSFNPVKSLNAGNDFWISNYIANTNSSNGDASNVTVTFRLPDRQFLDNNSIDFTGTSAYCSIVGLVKNCPDINGTIINNAPWLDPRNNANPALRPDVTCPVGGGVGSCSLVWQNIPKIYSSHKYPITYPVNYHFVIKVKSKTGVVNHTLICGGDCETTNITSTPSPGYPNFPNESAFNIELVTNPELTITKAPSAGYSNEILYGGSVKFDLTYSNASNGITPDAVVMDAIPNAINPGNGTPSTVTPMPHMIFEDYEAPNGESVFYMVDRDRSLQPQVTDPAWQPIGSLNPANKADIDWIMWKYSNPMPSGGAPRKVTITLTDTGSPNKTVFENKGYVTFFDGATYPTGSQVGSRVTVINPGFVTTSNGDVGSVGGIGFHVKSSSCVSPTFTSCSTTHLGISTGPIDSNFFASAKEWLLSDYSFATQDNPLVQTTNYAKMYKDYGKDAVACTNEDACLSGSEKVKIFTASSGNPFKITTNNYSGVPRIFFIDLPGGGDAFEINSNFTIGNGSALIFVVNGNVKVNYGVTRVEGMFLVEGQFSTGKRVEATASKDAGKFATISMGQDGFARIAYMSDNNVRFIKCNDLDCDTREYGGGVSASNVVSMSMTLYNNGGVDNPKIVVSQVDGSGVASTKFINCLDEVCLNNDVKTYNDTKDAAITIANGVPKFALGSGANEPRSASYSQCPDGACAGTPGILQIDGGVGNGVNKGNEIAISQDVSNSSNHLLVTSYVDRSLGLSDLWMAKQNTINTGTTCFGTTGWDCKRITGSPGNVKAFPGSATGSGNVTRFAYVDATNNQLKYVSCTDVACTALAATATVDCSATCTAQNYTQLYRYSFLNYILYNTISSGKKEVKVAYCFASCHLSTAWNNKYNLTNNGVFSTDNAVISNQGLTAGLVYETGMPRVVFYSEDDLSLYYIRCKSAACNPNTPSNLVYKKLDSGTPIALPDKQLTVNGSIIAYGESNSGPDVPGILLERDLFVDATIKPAEIFNLQPRYYYLLHDLVKKPEFIINAPP